MQNCEEFRIQVGVLSVPVLSYAVPKAGFGLIGYEFSVFSPVRLPILSSMEWSGTSL
jgi:hypothetical protein